MTLFPEGPPVGTSALPAAAQFWMPSDNEVEEGFGIGFFQDTWLIKDVPVSDAVEVVTMERGMADVVGRLARDGDHFESLASAAEFGSFNDPGVNLSDSDREELASTVSDIPELEGLELGVAGLVTALGTIGMLPAASCRSHASPRTWSRVPVVLFAAAKPVARTLQPLAAAAGCTFAVDDNHPHLLTVCGRSILNTMALAEAVLENRSKFM